MTVGGDGGDGGDFSARNVGKKFIQLLQTTAGISPPSPPSPPSHTNKLNVPEMYYPQQINESVSNEPAEVAGSLAKVPEELSASVMLACYINGGDSEDRARALEVEGDRLLALSDSESPETVQTLASHLPVLQALFFKLAKDAVICKSAGDKAKLLKASLQAQASYGRTVALLARLKSKTDKWDPFDEGCPEAYSLTGAGTE